MNKYFALLALFIFSNTVNAAAVLPSIDGGPFNGVPNNLSFAIAGTYVDNGPSGYGTGDVLDLTYTLDGNSDGPLIGLSIDFLGTLGAEVAPGIFGFSSSVITLDGPDGTEVVLTAVEALTGISPLFATVDLVLGMSATTVDPPIATDSISFLPVAYPQSVLPPNDPIRPGLFDFTLATGGLTGTSISFSGSGAVTGSAAGVVNPIPEPASLLTLLGCVAGVGAMGRRRRKAAAAA